jgi:DNA-binding transcriptional regulator LsrR (DeoR family)
MSDRDFLVQVATLYYRQGLSQQDIADRCRISRATVSNALRKAREEGIVEIRIRESPSLAWSLASDLESRFSLPRAVVVPVEHDAASTTVAIGRAAAECLASHLREGIRIGISWGTTLYQAVSALAATAAFAGVEVVQLLGALGSINPRFDGFELARALAEKLHGQYRVIQAPVIVASRELRELLLREPQIAETLQRAREADIALLGISSNNPAHSALVRAGFLTVEESREIYASGAVGHVCGLHFDSEGRILAYPLNDRAIGISAADLARIPMVIGAASGPEKVEAIRGVLRGGLLKVLVTDAATARGLLEPAELKGASGAERTTPA